MPFRAMGKNTWRPPAFTRRDVCVLAWGLASLPIITAADYIIPWAEQGEEEAVAMLVLFALSGICLVIGMTQKRHGLVWIGHMSLAVLNLFAMFFELLQFVLHLDGLRTGGLELVIVMLHWLYAIRMGPRPLNSSEVDPNSRVAVVETIETPRGDV